MTGALTPLLAMTAGIVILSSMLPDIAANHRNPLQAKGQDWRRPALQCFGYVMWVSYGLLRGDVYLATVTGTALVLSIVLLVQARRAIAEHFVTTIDDVLPATLRQPPLSISLTRRLRCGVSNSLPRVRRHSVSGFGEKSDEITKPIIWEKVP